MEVIKCKKCKKEISSLSKFCCYCGVVTKKVYCRSCGTEMDINDVKCKDCGYIESNSKNIENTRGEKYDFAMVGLICSFFAPIIGLILGYIAMSANKNQKNDARTFGFLAVIVSLIEFAFVFLFLIFYFLVLMFTLMSY